MNRTALSYLTLMLASLLFVGGCTRWRTVLPRPGRGVILAEDVDARVFVQVCHEDGTCDWIETGRRVRVPAGWWVMPPEDADEYGPSLFDKPKAGD